MSFMAGVECAVRFHLSSSALDTSVSLLFMSRDPLPLMEDGVTPTNVEAEGALVRGTPAGGL